jgi:2-polyprenyl-3-methyl-5-hydroxy-6-metoxy-1,4-benzoquinol methylase
MAKCFSSLVEYCLHPNDSGYILDRPFRFPSCMIDASFTFPEEFNFKPFRATGVFSHNNTHVFCGSTKIQRVLTLPVNLCEISFVFGYLGATFYCSKGVVTPSKLPIGLYFVHDGNNCSTVPVHGYVYYEQLPVMSCVDRGGCAFLYSGNDIFLVESSYNFHFTVDLVSTDEIGVCYGSDFAVFLDGSKNVSYLLGPEYEDLGVLKTFCFESKHPTFYFRVSDNPYRIIRWIVSLDESYLVKASAPGLYLSHVDQGFPSVPLSDDIACGNDLIELEHCESSIFLGGSKFFSTSDKQAVFQEFARKNGVKKSLYDYMTSVNYPEKVGEYSISSNIVNLSCFSSWRGAKFKEKKILDYGCGNTRFGKGVAKLLRADYAGFDVEGDSKDPSVTIGSMRVKSETIDCVILSHVLHHVCVPSYVIKQAVRVLKRKGFIILREHDVSTPYAYYASQYEHYLYFVSKMVDKISFEDYVGLCPHNYHSKEVFHSYISAFGFQRVYTTVPNRFNRGYTSLYVGEMKEFDGYLPIIDVMKNWRIDVPKHYFLGYEVTQIIRNGIIDPLEIAIEVRRRGMFVSASDLDIAKCISAQLGRKLPDGIEGFADKFNW